MNLQQVQAPVDGVDQAEAAGEEVDGTDAADGDAAGTVGDLLVNVARSHDRLVAAV
jgi:hypothetical protein